MAKGCCRGMLEVWPDPWCCFLCFCREPPLCCSDGVYGVLGGKEGQGWCDQGSAALADDVGTCRHPLQMCMEEVWWFL